jgi:hypothetical protein
MKPDMAQCQDDTCMVSRVHEARYGPVPRRHVYGEPPVQSPEPKVIGWEVGNSNICRNVEFNGYSMGNIPLLQPQNLMTGTGNNCGQLLNAKSMV